MGLETPPIEVVVVEVVVAVDSFGWSSQAALSPNFVVDGNKMIDATFWVPGAPGDSKDFAADGLPSKFYYQGHIDVQPIGAKAAKTAGQAAPVPPKDKAQIKVTGTGEGRGGGNL